MIEKIIIGVISIIAVIAAVFIRTWVIKRKGEQLHKTLQSQKESDAGRKLEIEILKEKMDEAIYALKMSELGVQYRGSSALYALPWFVVIGPSAAGKSTLLRHSGLHFPLAEEDIRIKGYGGTRNCDWWFSDEAIFLDTAGRYTTEENDHEEWQAFLKLLKKNRPRLPLNGILVVLSVSELLNFTEDDIKKHAKLIRERIAEMTSSLGYLFPVYIIFTKLDLLPGFSDFFNAESEKLLGVYLGNHLSDATLALNILHEKLLQRVFRQIHFADSYSAQLNIINFPAQFDKARKVLENFIGVLFKENPYQETPNFRGIYFTSVTTQAYFIKDLFTRVIFPYQFLKQKSKEKRLSLRWLKTASVVVALGMILGAFLLYSTSFAANTLLLQEAIRLTQQTIEANNKLPELRALSDYVNKLTSYRDDIPLHLRLGLYRGNDILPSLSHYLVQALNQVFLEAVADELEKTLMHYQVQWALSTDSQHQQMRGEYYSLLKVYLMLCEPEHMDPELATPILSEIWRRQNGMPANLLRSMVHFYITAPTRMAWTEKADLVQLSRQQLYSQADVNNLYAGFRTKGLAHFGQLDVPEFSSHQPVSLFFTKDAYENWVRKNIDQTAEDAMKGDWVMGSFQPNATREQVVQLKNQLQQLYFKDYITAWLSYLETLRLRSQRIEQFADMKDPISHLLLVINQNVDIDDSPVQHKFTDLINLSPDIIQNYLKQLSGIKAVLQKLIAMPDVEGESQQYVTQILSGNGAQSELYTASLAANTAVSSISDPDVKTALQNILLTPVKAAWQFILQHATRRLTTLWQTQVVSVYQQTLVNKFPFSPNGQDADLGEITKFFNESNGVLWQFINQNVMPYLQPTASGWAERTWLGIGAGFSPEFLSMLSKAKLISAGFFTESSTTPTFTFEIYPEPTPGLREITLITNGQRYAYRNDPQEWQKIHWPGQEPNDDTVLSIITANDGSEGEIEINSVWGFFKLLKQGRLSKNKDGTMESLWSIKSENGQHYQVSFLVKSSQSNNLFSAIMMDAFNLPAQLFS